MQIDTVMSGKECLTRMEKNAYHIIFMDHLMPEMAKQLELALKNENNVFYVQAHHEEFMAVYERVMSEVKTYINRS